MSMSGALNSTRAKCEPRTTASTPNLRPSAQLATERTLRAGTLHMVLVAHTGGMGTTRPSSGIGSGSA
jgi:hypothetical protein